MSEEKKFYKVKKWISRVHVRPIVEKTPFSTNASGKSAKGAYANILALANDVDEYRLMVQNEMLMNDLFVVEFDFIDTYENYCEQANADEEMIRLAEYLTPEYPVQYHTFHTYFDDDA